MSMGVVSIRMSIGKDLMLTFEVDLIDEEVPLIFGLGQHFIYKCSFNEYERTFTQDPSGTSAPIVFQTQRNGTGSHFYIKRNITSGLYTKAVLKKLHK